MSLLFSLKVAFVFCDSAIVFVLLEILAQQRTRSALGLVYAWHPLLATDVAGSGHIDIVGVLLLLVFRRSARCGDGARLRQSHLGWLSL